MPYSKGRYFVSRGTLNIFLSKIDTSIFIKYSYKITLALSLRVLVNKDVMRDKPLIKKDFFNRYVAKLAKRRQDMDRILELLDEKENSIKQLRYFYFCVFTWPYNQRTSTVVFQMDAGILNYITC